MPNKLYRGIRQENVAKVFVEAEELSLERAKKLRPSETTCEWGYFGEGPSQTALAILLDATDDEENSFKYFQDFKRYFIAPVDYKLGFTILQSQIQEWLVERIAQDSTGGWAI